MPPPNGRLRAPEDPRPAWSGVLSFWPAAVPAVPALSAVTAFTAVRKHAEHRRVTAVTTDRKKGRHLRLVPQPRDRMGAVDASPHHPGPYLPPADWKLPNDRCGCEHQGRTHPCGPYGRYGADQLAAADPLDVIRAGLRAQVKAARKDTSHGTDQPT